MKENLFCFGLAILLVVYIFWDEIKGGKEKKKPKRDPSLDVGPGCYVMCKVAGVSFNNRQQIISQIKIGDEVWISRDSTNQHDPNAYAVTWNNQEIGYLPSNYAFSVMTVLDTAHVYDVVGKVLALYPSKNLPTGVQIGFHLMSFDEMLARSNAYDYGLLPPPYHQIKTIDDVKKHKDM